MQWQPSVLFPPLCGFVGLSDTLIEQVLMSACKQRVWDHFTKAQRKNIEGWKNQTQVSTQKGRQKCMFCIFSKYMYMCLQFVPIMWSQRT